MREWTPRDYARDASDLTAEAHADALNELYAGSDDWDETPTNAEVARDEDWGERHAGEWGER